jgi:hypothetical protein
MATAGGASSNPRPMVYHALTWLVSVVPSRARPPTNLPQVQFDLDAGGHNLKASDKVLIYWASANRDEIEFERPELFDLDRKPNRHIAFGAGPHRCLGSNLARLNLRIAIGAPPCGWWLTRGSNQRARGRARSSGTAACDSCRLLERG